MRARAIKCALQLVIKEVWLDTRVPELGTPVVSAHFSQHVEDFRWLYSTAVVSIDHCKGTLVHVQLSSSLTIHALPSYCAAELDVLGHCFASRSVVSDALPRDGRIHAW